ncbi:MULTISPECIES: TolB-like translocation protein [Tenebrionibacter/Tenebrionicola group]|uniref:Uncharacterized protein n=2 Tax=Tenebrionibacter/Tenebrionicola group TaxID=2969848 RepID=A0A8K0V682_9ENTR|nr:MULTISPECIES: hypothetical protein [Tenebrionibacter/Tenebrionicola group]MBK4716158.1 hypothetical protein [Tenebrionibacter intestinalis]MBV5096951.1 hypothetical protein [Tenebrionicola larvae]
MKTSLALALLILCSGAAQASSAPPPWLPVYNDDIAVPEGVAPWLPTFSGDGRTIWFQNQYDGNIWRVALRDRTPRCVTCDFDDRPQALESGFSYALADNRRMFIATRELSPIGGSDDQTAFDGWMMECMPSLDNCQSHQFIPVDMAADRQGLAQNVRLLQRRTWHLAPDGVHLAWTDVRSDGTAMLVGELTRQDDRYRVENIRVVNPLGPDGAQSAAVDKAEYAAQLWELKSFVDGGKAILAVAELNGNIDPVKVDLDTGKTQRMTANGDWDEDGATSPDGSMEVVYSWRTRDRLEVTSAIPQLRNFIALPLMTNILVTYISSWPGFQCDLSSWLLPGTGDGQGKLTGQPLRIYENTETAGKNLAAQPFWNPNSTRILLQGRLREPVPDNYSDAVKTKGLVPPRVLMARLDKAPTLPKSAVRTVIGDWAPAVSVWRGPMSGNRSETFPGKASGSVTVTYRGDLFNGGLDATFTRYSDDGKTFLDGTVTSVMSLRPVVDNLPQIHIDVQVSGENQGSMKADIVRQLDGSLSGHWRSIYNGVSRAGLPTLGPCYDKLPQKTPLKAIRTSVGKKTQVLVSADIHGDERPVKNASVRANGLTVKTDAYGRAWVNGSPAEISISAGDTFQAITIK